MDSDSIVQKRDRSLLHREYLKALHTPSEEEVHRISDIQRQRESEINRKYHTSQEQEAATKIQKAYRGHRARRQLNGLTLDPSARWVDIIKEWRFRTATAPHYGPNSSRVLSDGRARVSSDMAKLNWRRAAQIAEHAVDGNYLFPSSEQGSFMSSRSDAASTTSQESVNSLLLDMRYFLEMVDQKHRYGANLLVYHEEWLRSQTGQNFFYWLDRGEGRHLSLPGCSREKLEKERIRYLSKDERRNYLVHVDAQGKLRWHKNDELITTSSFRFKDSMVGIVSKEDVETTSFNDDSVTKTLSESRRLVRRIVRTRSGSPNNSDISQESSTDSNDYGGSYLPEQSQKQKKAKCKRLHVSPATILNRLLRASVKPGTWIYVSDAVGRLYVGIKSSGMFQHASFLSGARISSAGSIDIENGQLEYLSTLSGHYRPTTESFRVFIHSLKVQGVDLSHLKVSSAFEVLLGMEYYGKTKKGVKKMIHHRNDSGIEHPVSPEPNDEARSESNLSATSQVEHHWNNEHRRGLAKLMDDLHIQRRSFDARRE